MKPTLPKQVENGLRDLSREEPGPFHFERMMARIQQPERRLNIMKATVRTALGIGFVCLVVLALILIPITYKVTVGSTVSVKIPVETGISHMDIVKAIEGLEGLENSNIRVSSAGMNLDFAFKPTRSSEAEKLVKDALSTVIEDLSTIAFNSENIEIERGGNALAAITGGRISINTDGLSDEQIEAAIIQAFAGRGFDETSVNVETSPDGTERRVEIRIEKELGEGEDCDDLEEITLELDGNMEGRRIIRKEIRE